MRTILAIGAAVVLAAVLAGCGASQAFRRGEGYASRGDWDLAVKEYRRALEKDPKNIEYRSTLLRAQVTAANHHFKRAQDFVRERKLDPAIVELQQGLFLSPRNDKIQSSLKSVLDMKQAEEHYRTSLTFTELNRLNEAVAELNQAVELDPENTKYRDALSKLQKKKSELEPDEALTLASDKPVTLNFKNTNIKEVFELLSKLSGINILFDEEVKAQPVTVFVKDVSFQEALNLLLSTNKLFMKKISADAIIIVPKTKAKIDQYQDLRVRTFYLNTARAKDMVNLLRSMLETKKVFVNESTNSITVRETPEKIKLVEKIIAANDLKEAEVILDVEILEIARSKNLNYGWNLTNSGQASAEIQSTDSSTTGTLTLNDLRNLSSENVVLKIPGIVVNLFKQDSDAQTLANPRVRVLNGKQAKFHIGDKIPIQTSTIQATTATQITSTFEYKDVGIKVTAEPLVHLNNTVTLKLGLEISNLGDALDFGGGQKQYKFGTRNADTVLNLRDGETVIIGGLIRDEERRSRVKIPGLGDVPVLGKLFSSTSESTVKTDVLMAITPNIVRGIEVPEKDVQNFWSGTEDFYDTKPLFSISEGKISKPAEKAADKEKEKAATLDAMARREEGAAAPGALPVAPVPPAAEPAKQQPAAIDTGGARLEIRPAEVTGQVGQEMRVELAVSNVRNLYGAIITLGYDAQLVDFRSASEGPFLKQDGQATSFLFSNNARAGTVDLYLTRIGDVGGVDGGGSLGTVVFQGKSSGAAEFSVRSVKLGNFAREQVKAEAAGARVTVK